jgi:predicted ATPase
MPVFMFTDIVGSAQLWEEYPRSMGAVIQRFNTLSEQCVQEHGGRVIKHTGDGMFAVFEAGEALDCALRFQKQVKTADWGVPLETRVAVHQGEAEQWRNDYLGGAVNRTARLLATVNGSQILFTPPVMQICRLPAGAAYHDHGVHLLKDLSEPQQVYELLHPDLSVHPRPPKSLSMRPNNLPRQASAFVARAELKTIMEAFIQPDCRLLTLVGSGGIGKTRLAVQAAAELFNESRLFGDRSPTHEVYFLDLAPLAAPDMLVPAIASIVKFNFYRPRDLKTQLLNYLRDKKILFILDNFESLLEGAELVGELLDSAPRIKILVTSRTPLNLPLEQVFHIQGMAFPKHDQASDFMDYDAVRLFIQSARRSQRNFMPSDADRKAIARICQLVEGLPLAIELAAAFTGVFSCDEIATHIEERLDFLKTSEADLPERHRSLRATLDYFWNLLSPAEQQVLRKLTVFRGGFREEAARRVAGASPFFLSALVDRAFLRRTARRYQMHELLRQHAKEDLDRHTRDRRQARNLHCDHYAEFVLRRTEDLKNSRQEPLQQMAEEFENIQLAWKWAVQNQKTQELNQLLDGLYTFYDTRGWSQEGEAEFGAAARQFQHGGDSALLAKLQARQAMFQFYLGHFDSAKATLERCLSLFEAMNAPAETAFCLTTLGKVAEALGEYADAGQLYERGLAIYREIGLRRGIAYAVNGLGIVADDLGDFDKARQCHLESIAICRELDDQRGMAQALNNLANVLNKLGEFEDAQRYYTESLNIHREIEDVNGIAGALNNLGNVVSDRGEYELGEKYYRESYELYKSVGNQQGVALTLANLGNNAYFTKRYDEAQELERQSLEIRRKIGDRYGIVVSLITLGTIALDLKQYAQAREIQLEVLAVSKEIGFQYGIVAGLGELGAIAGVTGEYQEAKRYLHESITLGIALQAHSMVNTNVVTLCTSVAAEGRVEDAVKLLSYALHHAATSQADKDRAGRVLDEMKSELSPERFTAAFEEGKAASLESLLEGLFTDAVA